MKSIYLPPCVIRWVGMQIGRQVDRSESGYLNELLSALKQAGKVGRWVDGRTTYIHTYILTSYPLLSMIFLPSNLPTYLSTSLLLSHTHTYTYTQCVNRAKLYLHNCREVLAVPNAFKRRPSLRGSMVSKQVTTHYPYLSSPLSLPYTSITSIFHHHHPPLPYLIIIIIITQK